MARRSGIPILMRAAVLVCSGLLCNPDALAFQTAAAGDDTYAFAAGRSEERQVELTATDQGLRWAWARPAADRWDTALLGVRVVATAPDPWVELAVGERRLQQYLDASARGLRWLNLTSLRPHLTDGSTVEIRGNGVTIDPGPATLRVFANQLDLTSRILILAPHPDDAEIAAFGLYAGRNATIVTVTSGNAGDFNYKDQVSDPASHYLLKGYLRTVDSVTIPWHGGIPPERCFNLGYFDARLKAMRDQPEVPISEMYGPNTDVSVYRRANIGRLLSRNSRSASWKHLVEDLVEVLRRVKPEIIVMPHPFLDSHADHQYVAVAAVEALERWTRRATFLLYTNHASENLYPFGPAGTVMSLPPWPGPGLPVEGVYSHSVTPDLQLRKLFALEAMHDLRLSPEEQSSCGNPAAPRRPDYPRIPAVDYFRRGPRADEVFFVFGRDGVRDLIRSFLAQTHTIN